MNQELKVKKIGAPFLIKNYIKGIDNYRYEDYLIELLNSSLWFSKNGFSPFHAPESEANGECDAISENYQLDFKLFACETLIKARNLFSYQIRVHNNITSYGACKCPHSEMEAYKIYEVFRDLNMEDLIRYRDLDVKREGIEKDIKFILQLLETDKNLLLFSPYEFFFEKEHELSEAIQIIQESLTHDFRVAFTYRNERVKKDTFLTCLYDGLFLLFEESDGELKYIDSVSARELPTYRKIDRYANVF